MAMNQTTTATELKDIANKILPKTFLGVFSIDTLPMKKYRNCMFITNTDASNLPGTHWIAIIIQDTIGYVFDPMGFPPHLKISYWMNNNCNKWSTNIFQVQPYLSNLCGQYCIHFLYFASANYLNDKRFDDIVTLLYPKRFSPSIWEKTVIDFTNLML